MVVKLFSHLTSQLHHHHPLHMNMSAHMHVM